MRLFLPKCRMSSRSKEIAFERHQATRYANRINEVEEMTHPIHRVQTFEIVAAYTLRVQFEDGTAQTIDFRPMLQVSFTDLCVN